jgi:hypothetical protein
MEQVFQEKLIQATQAAEEQVILLRKWNNLLHMFFSRLMLNLVD